MLALTGFAAIAAMLAVQAVSTPFANALKGARLCPAS